MHKANTKTISCDIRKCLKCHLIQCLLYVCNVCFTAVIANLAVMAQIGVPKASEGVHSSEKRVQTRLSEFLLLRSLMYSLVKQGSLGEKRLETSVQNSYIEILNYLFHSVVIY